MQLIVFPFVRCGRSRPHQTHIALQHVEELRKLIQTAAPEEFTESGFLCSVRQNLIPDDAGIEVHLEHQPVRHAVPVLQLLLMLLRVYFHRTQLQNLKTLAVAADALLPEQDRPGRGKLDHRSEDQHNEHGQDTAGEPAREVPRALDEQLHRRGIVRGMRQDIISVDFLHKAFPAHGPYRQQNMNRNRHLSALLDQS